ncbi:hypothetical protein COLO4_16431 [Corchorus olitorius]|uniref:Uncharacterized protein n=1 Tax=Corchorus olitorius TaxID=93759 RepID=A0A1R3JHJ2_9ROSI|nr:hypothetical protein COLO4_16431 [Corchorus olitorius]
MEERATLPTDPIDNPNSNNTIHQEIVQVQQSEAAFRSGTYVIQVPKDQIYRVPPPENALIAQRHQNNNIQGNKDTPCCSRLWCCIVFIIVVLLLVLAILAWIIYTHLIKP